MNLNKPREEVFSGMVKYGGCSGSVGSAKWKMGAIVIDKDDTHGWRIKMNVDCSETPNLSYPLTSDTLKKYVCKDTTLIVVSKDDKNMISLYLKANDRRAAKRIESLCVEVLTKNAGGKTSNPSGWSQTCASDAVHEFTCTPCFDDGKNTEALYHCNDCHIFYCQRCVMGHNKFTKHHTVVDKMSRSFGQVQRQPRLFQSRELPTDLCEEHNGEVINMFCGNHDVVCCTVCIAMKHRSCEGVEYLPNVAEDLLKRLNKNNTVAHMEEIKLGLHFNKMKMLNEMGKLKNQRDSTLADIRRFKTRLLKRIDELERKAITDVLEKHKDIAKGLTANNKKIDNLLSDVEMRLDRLKHSKRSTETQTFVDITYDVTQPVLRSANRPSAFDPKWLKSTFGSLTSRSTEFGSNYKPQKLRSASQTPAFGTTNQAPAFRTACETPSSKTEKSDYLQSDIPTKKLKQNPLARQ